MRGGYYFANETIDIEGYLRDERRKRDAQVADGAYIAGVPCDGDDQILGGGCSILESADNRLLINSEPVPGGGWQCKYQRRQFDVDNNVETILC